MEFAGIVGLLVGLLGALAGVATMIFGLGYFEYLGGKKSSKFAIGKEDLKQKLLALNSPDLPYKIRPAEQTDLIAEWKIVDAKWYSLFAKGRLSKTYRAYIVLDERLKTVRYCEESGTVSWSAGAEGLNPNIGFQKSFFKGRILFQKSWGVQYGIKQDLSVGKVYDYKFDIRGIREPLLKVIEESGWEFVGVVRLEHATYDSIRKTHA